MVKPSIMTLCGSRRETGRSCVLKVRSALSPPQASPRPRFSKPYTINPKLTRADPHSSRRHHTEAQRGVGKLFSHCRLSSDLRLACIFGT